MRSDIQFQNFMKFKEMTCFAGNRLNVISSVNLAAACYLPKETGPCRGYFIRYFYNISTGRCQRFAYGGCQGNKNNFKTFGECNNHCVVSKSHLCCFFQRIETISPADTELPRCPRMPESGVSQTLYSDK